MNIGQLVQLMDTRFQLSKHGAEYMNAKIC